MRVGAIDASERMLIDALPDRVAVVDARGRVVVANAAWQRTCGPRRSDGTIADPEGLDYFDRCMASPVGPAGEHAAQVRAGIERVLAGEATTFTHEYPCKSGLDWYRVDVIAVSASAARAMVRHLEITASRRAEAERRASDKLVRVSLEESADAVILHDTDGRVVDLNAAATRHFGWPREVLIGKTPEFFDKRGDRPLVEHIYATLRSGQLCVFETEHTRRDGSVVPVEVRMRAFVMDGREHHISFTYDITARKQAEAALREALERLEKVAARLPGFVYQYRRERDGRTRFPYASEGIRDLFGITPDEAYADPACVFAVVHPDDRAILESSARESLRDLIPWRVSFRLRLADGTVRWVAGNAIPERTPEGATIWHGFVLDITEQRRAEEALRLSDAALRSISQGVVISDTDHRVLSVNPAFTAMTGLTSEELVGQPCTVLLAAQAPDVVAALLAAEARGEEFSREVEDVRKDGTTYWNDLTVTPVKDASGRVTHFVGVSRDISRRKQAEEALLAQRGQLEALVQSRTAELAGARDAAEAASRAKTTFLANMSHELRTPMSGIMGMTDLALRRATDPVQAEYLAKSAQASRHLLAIINDILDLSRIEAGRLDLDPQDFDVRQLVEETLRMQEAAARAKGLAITVQIDPALPERLNADPLRLRQILLNYVGNAIKFSERGEIRVRVGASAIDRDGMTLRMEVEDEGIGIPPEHQPHLFQPFMQADQSTTRVYGGTGLGLAISQRLAHALGGDVGCRSTPGQGSMFWMTARVTHASPADAPATVVEAPDLARLRTFGGRRILLADDQPVAQEVVRLLLEAAGLPTDVVANGAEAVERAATGNYALVLMDVHMPVMDGLEATRAIRRLPQCAELPIVAMTAAVFDVDRERCIAAGMDAHLAKPVSPEDLWRVLLQFLDRDPAALATGPAARATTVAAD
jgi:PAS domain S-box-containing protein